MHCPSCCQETTCPIFCPVCRESSNNFKVNLPIPDEIKENDLQIVQHRLFLRLIHGWCRHVYSHKKAMWRLAEKNREVSSVVFRPNLGLLCIPWHMTISNRAACAHKVHSAITSLLGCGGSLLEVSNPSCFIVDKWQTRNVCTDHVVWILSWNTCQYHPTMPCAIVLMPLDGPSWHYTGERETTVKTFHTEESSPCFRW